MASCWTLERDGIARYGYRAAMVVLSSTDHNTAQERWRAWRKVNREVGLQYVHNKQQPTGVVAYMQGAVEVDSDAMGSV